MDYRVASNIRGKSLSSLMTDKIVSGGGVGSALSGAISDKLKARATGVKEKFDPMNIAKFMTGGSKLAPAILGRLTGRSQSDINYFAGAGKTQKSSYTQVPTQMTTPGEGLGGSAVEVLNRMLSFMQTSREEDLKRKDTAKQFVEEQKVEEQRRHNEFLKVLKEYTSLGTTTLMKKEDGGGDFLSGLMETIKSMIATAISGVTALFNTALKAYEWIKDLRLLTKLAPYASGLVTFLGTTFGALFLTALTPAALLLYLAKAEKDAIEKDPYDEKYKDNPYAMKRRGEAKTIGQATAINQNKAARQFPRQLIAEYVKSKLTDTELINNPGAPGADRATLQNWLDSNPKPSAMFQGSVAAIAGQPETAIPAGGKSLVKPTATQADVRKLDNAAMSTPVAPTQADVRKLDNAAMATPVAPTQSDVRKIDNDLMSTPVPEVPISSRMNSAIDENQDLSLQTNTDAQSYISPVITTNSNSVDLPDRPIPTTALVRDKTPILDYVLQGNMAPV